MYIIDADTHISNIKEGNSITAEELIAMMDRAGIEKALTWIQPPYQRDLLPRLIEYLENSAKAYRDRIIPFGWVDPHLGITNSKLLIRKCMLQYGFKGIKLNGAQNEYPVDDEELSIPLIREIADLGGIIAFHCGADVRDYTHPYRIEKILKMFPHIKFLMVHMGGASFSDFSDTAIEVAERNNNVTLIGSAIRTRPLINAIKRIGPERIAYGSDAPFEFPSVEISRYKAIFELEFPEDYYSEWIMSKTMQKVLGLE